MDAKLDCEVEGPVEMMVVEKRGIVGDESKL